MLTETSAKHFGVFNKALPYNIILPKSYKAGKGTVEYLVCGIIKDLGFYDEMNQKKEVFPLITRAGRTTTVRIRIGEDINPTEIQANINEIARKRYGHLNPRVEMIHIKKAVYRRWEGEKDEILPLLSLIPLILFYTLIALFGLFWNDVKRKKVDFGVMRAIGFNKMNIFKIVIAEALLFAAIPALFNLFIIFNFKSQLNDLFNAVQGEIGIYELWLLSTLAITILIVLASIVPAIKTTHIQPAEALSNE